MGQKPGKSCFSPLGSHGLKSRWQQGCISFRRLLERICFQSHSGCWQNLVPCGCGTEVPVSLLADTGDCSTCKGHPHSLAHGLVPPYSKTATVTKSFLFFESLWPPPCLLSLTHSSAFQGTCSYIGPTRIICLRVSWLVTVDFMCKVRSHRS